MTYIHILSVLLFWRDEIISSYWVDLYEHLKNDTKSINLLNSEENKSLIGIQEGNGWLEKFGYPIRDYFTKIQRILSYSKLKTENVFHLLRSFRHSVSHKSGCDEIRHSRYLNKLKMEVDKIFEHGRVKCWLENFPEFSLITCRAGYDAGLHFSKVNMKSIDESCKPQYISLTTTTGNLKKTVPLSLHDYSEALFNWIISEVSNKRTDIWKHSLTTEIDKIEMEITFLAIPKNSPDMLINREVLTLNWIPHYNKNATVHATTTLQTSRKIISLSEEHSDLFNLSTATNNSPSTIKMEYKTNSKKTYPFLVFTDVLSSALKACLDERCIGKKYVIFTNQPIDFIKRTVNQFFNSRNIKFVENFITWDNLSAEYQNELSVKEFPLHVNSNIMISINEINKYFERSSSSNRVNNVGRITYTKGNLRAVNTSQTNDGYIDANYLEINSMLLELMQDTSQILGTLIEHRKNLLTRYVLHREKIINREIYPYWLGDNIFIEENIVITDRRKVFKENSLPDFILQEERSLSKNIYIIYGPNAIGKSTFVSEVGYSLIHKNELVLFTTCSSIISAIRKSSERKFLEILWHHNKFQQKVAYYMFNVKKPSISIIFDRLHELSLDERKLFFEDFLVPFLKEYTGVVINIFLTARSSDSIFQSVKFDIGNKLKCKVHCLHLMEISSTAIENYMKELFRLNDVRAEDSTLTTRAKYCMQLIDETLGISARTPLVCKFITEIFRDFQFTPVGSLKIDSEEVFNIYEKFHNIHLREEAAKTIINHMYTKDFKITGLSINVSSTIFQSFKELVEKNHGYQSFKLRFPEVDLGNFEGNSSTIVSSTVLDLSQASKTFLPDYYCSLFMMKCKNFVTGEVFAFSNVKNRELKFLRTLTFLDILIKKENAWTKFERMNNFSIKGNTFRDVLCGLLHCQLYNVLITVIETLPWHFESIKKGSLCEVNEWLNSVMTLAIQVKSIKTIEFLDKVGFNFREFKLGKLLLFSMKKLNLAIDKEVLKYLVEKRAGISDLKSNDLEWVKNQYDQTYNSILLSLMK